MTTRRLLMTTDAVGGVWTYALSLVRGLAEHGWSADLATLGAPLSAAQRGEAESVPGLRLHESTFALEWMRDPWDEVDRAGVWLLELERRSRPDVIHLNGYAYGALPTRAPRVVVGHSCVLSWGRALGRDVSGAYATYAQRVAAGLRGAHRVVAPSNAMLGKLEHHYGPSVRGVVIYNGVERGRWRPATKGPWILAAGRVWDESKNLEALAEAAAYVPWPICIAGSSRAPDGRRVDVAGAHLLGQLAPAELAEHMARASIFVHPARYEPFGLAPLEAAASGCALVLGDIDSLRELWEGAALFVSPDDTAAIRRALDRLIHERELRDELAARARQRSCLFTVARQAKLYAALYAELLSERGAEGGRDADPAVHPLAAVGLEPR